MKIQDKIDLVLRCREAGHVMRCHTIRTNSYHDVAQHTYNVMVLLHALHPCPSSVLVKAVLYHDVQERWTGDVPAGLRYFAPEVRTGFKKAEKVVNEKLRIPMPDFLIEHSQKWLTALDQLEFWLWCHDEIHLGNEHAKPYLQTMDEWFLINKYDIPSECLEFVEKFRWYRTSQKI